MTEDQTESDDKGAPVDAANAGAAAPATPEERAAALEAEKNDLRERMLRIAADFDNYKKRTRKEIADAETRGKEGVLKDMLEVIDNLERATAVDEKADVKSVRQGVGLVVRLFQSKLERHEVRPFDAKGQSFDPRIHDAISQVPSAEVPAGSVLSELQKGYRIGERLLRPALVVVALAPPAPASVVPEAGGGDTPAGAGNGPAGSHGGGGSGAPSA